MKYFIILTSVFFVMSCAKKGSSTERSSGFSIPGLGAAFKKDNNSSPLAPKIEVKEEFIAVDERPNEYLLKIEWNGTQHYSDLQIYRTQDSYPTEKLILDSSNSFSEKVKGGSSYNYRITGVWNGQKYLLFEKKMVAPLDYVVKGESTLKETFKSPSGRLFFEAQSVLKTEGADLLLDFKNILSAQNATIDTTPPGEAPNGQKGKAGGKLWLRAQNLKGSLRIIAKGQKGGEGFAGMPGSNGARGQDGRTGLQGLCGSGSSKYQSTPGESGQDGGTGGSGGRGAQGGDSAHLKIEISEADFSQIKIEAAGGDGGRGGSGGAGGTGGEGGRGGKAGYFSGTPESERIHCDAPDGARGRDGMRGAAGPEGERGVLQEICYKNSTKIFMGLCAEVDKIEFFKKL